MKGGVSDDDDSCFLTENSLKYVFQIDGPFSDSLKQMIPLYTACETDTIKKVAAMAWNELSATLEAASASMIKSTTQRKLCLLAQEIQNAVVHTNSAVAEAPAAPKAVPIVVPPALLKEAVMEPTVFVLPPEPPIALQTAPTAEPLVPNGAVEPLQKKLKLLERRVEEAVSILNTIRNELQTVYHE